MFDLFLVDVAFARKVLDGLVSTILFDSESIEVIVSLFELILALIELIKELTVESFKFSGLP